MKRKEKYERYKELMFNLDKAIKNEFYYEAIFIEYAIMEDRTDSLLKHAKISYLDKDGRSLKLDKKLNKIRSTKNFRDKYVLKHIDDSFLDSIYTWKDKRNKLIHHLIGTVYTNNDVQEIALDGYTIVKRINAKSSLVTKYFDRLFLKED